jgi:hypothetical protein
LLSKQIKKNDMGETRIMDEAEKDAYTDLVGKPEGRTQLARFRRRWRDNTKMDFQELG